MLLYLVKRKHSIRIKKSLKIEWAGDPDLGRAKLNYV